MYIAIKGFCGQISARKDQIIEINDKKVAQDLLNAGYIEVYNEKPSTAKEINKQIELQEKQIKDLENDKMSMEKEIENLKNQLMESSTKELELDENSQDVADIDASDDNNSVAELDVPTENK